MRSTMRSRFGWAALIASTALIALAAPASAADPFTIASAVSGDPVMHGETVTDTFTLTNNTPGCDCDTTYDFGMLLLRSKSDAAVANPFVSVTSSYGSCTIDPVDSHGYHSATCHLGAHRDIPQTVQIAAEIQANESMDNYASLLQDGSYPIGIVGNALTHVIYPPAFTGSEKIRLKGLPAGCATGDLTIKAHVKGADVGHIVATLGGPRDEWGARHADSFSKKIAHGEGSTLKAKVQGSKLEAGFYNLAFVATSKGHPSLRRAVTFQLC